MTVDSRKIDAAIIIMALELQSTLRINTVRSVVIRRHMGYINMRLSLQDNEKYGN